MADCFGTRTMYVSGVQVTGSYGIDFKLSGVDNCGRIKMNHCLAEWKR